METVPPDYPTNRWPLINVQNTGDAYGKVLRVQYEVAMDWQAITDEDVRGLSSSEQALYRVSVWNYVWGYVARVLMNTYGVKPEVFVREFPKIMNNPEVLHHIDVLKHAVSRQQHDDVGLCGIQSVVHTKMHDVIHEEGFGVEVSLEFPYIAVEEDDPGGEAGHAGPFFVPFRDNMADARFQHIIAP